MENFKIRDMRIKEKYFMDDAYLNGYAKLCGIYATGIYVSLCRHSNTGQTCFPSIKLIAEELDISEKAVRTHLKKLTYWKIIQITQGNRRKGGIYAPNIYTLLDKSEWRSKPEVSPTNGTKEQQPKVSKDTDQRYPVPHKDTHSKETQNKDTEANSGEMISLLKAFEILNPACSKYYSNTTQRSACKFLIDTYSFERVLGVIENTLPKTNRLQYFPTITTPIQLQERWSNLESAIIKHKQSNKPKRIIV